MVMQPNTFPWHPADALELAARCGVHMPSASTSVLAAVLVLCFLFGVWGWKTVNTFKFYRLGVPAAAQHFLKVHASGVAVVNFWQAGRVTFIARQDAAHGIFSSAHFHARLGEPAGLAALGTEKNGIIWNNCPIIWSRDRKLFNAAVQGICHKPKASAAAVQASLKAFKLTAQQVAAEAADVPSSTELKEMCGRKITVDGLRLLRVMTFRITCCLMLGLDVASLTLQEASHVVRCVNGYFKAWEYFLLRPKWVQTLQFRSTAKHNAAVQQLRNAIQDLIELAVPSHNSSSFITDLMELCNKGVATKEDLMQNVLEMILAGTDTSSVSMFFFLLACRDDPCLQLRLAQEVEGLGEADTWASGPAEQPKFHEATLLPLVHASLSESMRSKPVGPVSIRQATADTVIVLKDRTLLRFEKGDTAIISLAEMHRDPQSFPHPDVFDVRNFENNQVSPEAFRPFGHGRKGCVGRPLAWLEMKVLMVAFFRHFAIANDNTASLASMPTKWEIAAQPTCDTPLRLVIKSQTAPRRVLLCGPHGSGKTTLLRDIAACYPDGSLIVKNEVARKVMGENCISRTDMQDPLVYTGLQSQILHAQSKAEKRAASNRPQLVLSDRCGLDPLAYNAWRFGMDSAQVKILVKSSTAQELLSSYRCDDTRVLLVVPFDDRATMDDGVRLTGSAQEAQDLTAAFKEIAQQADIRLNTIEPGSPAERVQQATAVMGCLASHVEAGESN